MRGDSKVTFKLRLLGPLRHYTYLVSNGDLFVGGGMTKDRMPPPNPGNEELSNKFFIYSNAEGTWTRLDSVPFIGLEAKVGFFLI